MTLVGKSVSSPVKPDFEIQPLYTVSFRWACVKKFEEEDIIGCSLKAERIKEIVVIVVLDQMNR